ncbi:ABC transporter permease [Streptomyces sp. NPDC004629]|uniref:ABC transporter permease n=1 Tax=Streptomyces sp. NPDC004629 TaxID=3364705 RepID=UPI0036CBF486
MTLTSQAAPTAGPAAGAKPGRRPAALGTLLRNRLAVVALAVLAVLLVAAVFAPLLAPDDPNAQDLLTRLKPPAWQHGGSGTHLLGTDQLGRDMFSRVVYGTRVSLPVGAGAALLAGVIGTVVGLAADYFGGWPDRVLMRLADVQLAFPSILLALAIVGFFGSGLWYVILVLGITGWVSYARVVRSEVMSLRSRDFVTEARALGAIDVACWDAMGKATGPRTRRGWWRRAASTPSSSRAPGTSAGTWPFCGPCGRRFPR